MVATACNTHVWTDYLEIQISEIVVCVAYNVKRIHDIPDMQINVRMIQVLHGTLNRRIRYVCRGCARGRLDHARRSSTVTWSESCRSLICRCSRVRPRDSLYHEFANPRKQSSKRSPILSKKRILWRNEHRSIRRLTRQPSQIGSHSYYNLKCFVIT